MRGYTVKIIKLWGFVLLCILFPPLALATLVIGSILLVKALRASLEDEI
jgi:hypothetical protein